MISRTKPTELRLSDIVGRGYATFWNSTARYRVVKGSRASKKSKTFALFYIIKLLEHPQANVLVVRRYGRTLRDSCFQDLKWAISRLGFESDFECTVSPLEIRRVSTGQKILFRGLDDGMKITSITVSKGVLCWVWIEEAFEITNETDFNKLDLSIRGQMPDGLYPQFSLSLNPWSEKCWIKARFFDRQDPNILALTTNYLCNEWLSEGDLKLFEDLKRNNPKRYRIEGLGEWGIAEGLIYENVDFRPLDRAELLADRKLKTWSGMDFGYQDPTAWLCGAIDEEKKIIYIFDELYERGLTNQQIAQRLRDYHNVRGEKIVCDSAEPKSIEELRQEHLNAVPAVKGPDSVRYGIQAIQNYKIIADTRCANFRNEILNYAWAKDRKTGEQLGEPEHDFSHLMDAMRYGTSLLIAGKGNLWRAKMF